MDQDKRRLYLIQALIKENKRYSDIRIPPDADGQCRLLRALMNVREPIECSREFLSVQNEYLKERIAQKGVTDYKKLTPITDRIYLWQGDITTLRCDAIVNAANDRLLGCFCPNHGCIDNAIHTYAGVQLRLECAKIMAEQGFPEPAGKAKITSAYNLPSKYILHTVGPIVSGRLRRSDEQALESCYRSCFELAVQNGVKSIAFCCVSTGEYGFPNDKAAKIAVETVRECLSEYKDTEVIFNVFKDIDRRLYRQLLG